jgi:hypothetical protein
VDIENTASIERIKAKLAELQELDPTYKVFGSSSHRYRPRPPLTASELADCETILVCGSQPTIEISLCKSVTVEWARSMACFNLLVLTWRTPPT